MFTLAIFLPLGVVFKLARVIWSFSICTAGFCASIVERQRQLLALQRDAEIEQHLPTRQVHHRDGRGAAVDVADRQRL